MWYAEEVLAEMLIWQPNEHFCWELLPSSSDHVVDELIVFSSATLSPIVRQRSSQSLSTRARLVASAPASAILHLLCASALPVEEAAGDTELGHKAERLCSRNLYGNPRVADLAISVVLVWY